MSVACTPARMGKCSKGSMARTHLRIKLELDFVANVGKNGAWDIKKLAPISDGDCNGLCQSGRRRQGEYRCTRDCTQHLDDQLRVSCYELSALVA